MSKFFSRLLILYPVTDDIGMIGNSWVIFVISSIRLDNWSVLSNSVLLITNINGYNDETMNAVIYAKTGYRHLDQLKEEGEE